MHGFRMTKGMISFKINPENEILFDILCQCPKSDASTVQPKSQFLEHSIVESHSSWIETKKNLCNSCLQKDKISISLFHKTKKSGHKSLSLARGTAYL